MLRVAVLTEAFPTLSETFVVQLALECLRRDCDVHIVALRRGDDDAITPELTGSGLLDRVTYLDVPRTRADRLRSAPAAVARLARHRMNPLRLLSSRRHGPAVFNLRGLVAAGALAGMPARSFDVVHAHFGKNGLLALQLRDAALLSGAIMTTFHGQDATAYPRSTGRNVYDALFARTTMVTTASGFIAERLRRLGAPQGMIARLPMPFDSTRFAHHVRTPPDQGPVRLLTVGRLVEKKGISDVLTAVAHLIRHHGMSVRYEVIGDGPLRVPLQRRADELGIAHAVTFRGAQRPDEVARAYDRAHLFVLASTMAADGDHEGLGVALLEAQASGLPVVATRHDGFPEAVVEHESAVLVDERSPDQLAAAILDLVGMPWRWEAMGRAGRKHVTDTFARDVVGARLVELLWACASSAT